MPEIVLFPERGHPRPGKIQLEGSFTIGGAGAISAQDGLKLSGCTVAKNAAAGRYDVTFYKPFKALISGFVQMVGPASAAFPTTTGSDPQLRPSNGPTATSSNVQVQFKRTDTQADADAASGTVCYFYFEVTDLTVF